MFISATNGKIMFNNRSSSISLYICSEGVEKGLYPIIKKQTDLTDNFSKIKIDKNGWEAARNGLDHKIGGYWTQNTIDFPTNKEYLLKVVVTEHSRTNKVMSVGYYVVRNGGAVGQITAKRIFTETGTSSRDRKILSQEKIIATGCIEPVEIKDVEKIYGMKINPIYRSAALGSMKKRLIKYTEIKPAVIKAPKLQTFSVDTIHGKKEVIARSVNKPARRLRLNRK